MSSTNGSDSKIIVHSYLTEGMFDNAIPFLRSLLSTNRDAFKVILSTRNLNSGQIIKLHAFYPDLHVQNENLDYSAMARRAECSVDTLLKYKHEVETGYVSQSNKVWKLMIAAEDRPRSLYQLLACEASLHEPVLHFDIDTLFRKEIWSLAIQGRQYDCCLLLRENMNPVKTRITISTMTWKTNMRTLTFFERWMYYLDIVPPPMRPIGYGQTSCWLAFEEMRESLKYKKLGPAWGYPGRSSNKEGNYIWSGAVHKMRKDDCAKIFGDELRRLQCGL